MLNGQRQTVLVVSRFEILVEESNNNQSIISYYSTKSTIENHAIDVYM